MSIFYVSITEWCHAFKVVQSAGDVEYTESFSAEE